MHVKYTLNNQGIGVNTKLPLMMHIDMNSFFATCEQQENPILRGKPVGVVPGLHQTATIVAASIEAKKYGVKTGTKVRDALKICPDIVFKEADPEKYRYINKKFMQVFNEFCADVAGKSIDEAVLNFSNTKHDSELVKKVLKNNQFKNLDISKLEFVCSLEIGNCKLEPEFHRSYVIELAETIRDSLKVRVGEYLKCSIGVGPNYFIAKVASGIYKPEGFYYVDHKNIETFYDMLSLQDLHGIAKKSEERLNNRGIYTPLQFYQTSLQTLQFEFNSFGTYWYLRLRGHEIDDYKTKRSTVGHSYHLPKFTNDEQELKAILLKLTSKACYRLRKYGIKSRCFSFFILYSDGTSWHKSHRIKSYLDSTKEVYEEVIKIFDQRQNKYKKARIIGMSTSNFIKKEYEQKDLFSFVEDKTRLYKAVDTINEAFGDFTIMPATLLNHKSSAPDRIAFGNKD